MAKHLENHCTQALEQRKLCLITWQFQIVKNRTKQNEKWGYNPKRFVGEEYTLICYEKLNRDKYKSYRGKEVQWVLV